LLKSAGAAYLAWLGVQMLRAAWRGETVALAQGGATVPARSLWSDFRTGVLTNVLNPKVALFFVAFLPQFVPAASPSPAASLALLGGWFVVQNLFYMLGLVWSTMQRALNAAGGLLFVGLALRLLGARPGAA
jgi:threonine/homoserine/homoserine lactone efflux protein